MQVHFLVLIDNRNEYVEQLVKVIEMAPLVPSTTIIASLPVLKSSIF